MQGNINYDDTTAIVHILSIFQKNIKLFFDIFMGTLSKPQASEWVITMATLD